MAGAGASERGCGSQGMLGSWPPSPCSQTGLGETEGSSGRQAPRNIGGHSGKEGDGMVSGTVLQRDGTGGCRKVCMR